MNLRVLIVDDHPVNLELASEVLALESWTVEKATDAQEALALLHHALPDLILMDIALPGMDGLALTRQLKADPRTRGVRIIALTAFAMKGDDRKAYAAGCDGYIAKPIDTRRLPAQIAAILQSSDTAAPAAVPPNSPP